MCIKTNLFILVGEDRYNFNKSGVYKVYLNEKYMAILFLIGSIRLCIF